MASISTISPEQKKIKKIGSYDGHRTNAFYGFNVPQSTPPSHFNVPVTPSKYVPLRFDDSLEATFGMSRPHSIDSLSQIYEENANGLSISESLIKKTNQNEPQFKLPLSQDLSHRSPVDRRKFSNIHPALKLSPFASRLPEMNFSLDSSLRFLSPVVPKPVHETVQEFKSAPHTSGYNSMESNTMIKEIIDTVSRISVSLQNQTFNQEDSIDGSKEKSLNDVHELESIYNELENDSSKNVAFMTEDKSVEKVDSDLKNCSSLNCGESITFYNDFLSSGDQVQSSTPNTFSIFGEEDSNCSLDAFALTEALTPFERHKIAKQRTVKKTKKNVMMKFITSRKLRKQKIKIEAEKETAKQCAKTAEVNEMMEESLDLFIQGVQLIGSVFGELSDHLRSFQGEVTSLADSSAWKTNPSKPDEPKE